MSGPNYSEELENIVKQMLTTSPHEQFRKYWEMYKETAYISAPKAIYFRISQDATYRNIAIAGDTGVVDIDADENVGGNTGVSVSLYRSLSEIILHMGPLLTLSRTQDSLLTVACRVGPGIGPYWSAHSEDEVERLRKFAKFLVESVSL